MDNLTKSSERSTVLVSEDSDFIRRVICSTLKKSGYLTIEARDGSEARKLLATANADLILSDFNMPNLNGQELLEAARNEPATANTPVVILSSETRRDLMDQAIAAGASAWLTKPFQTAELLATIEQALGKSAALPT